MDNVFRLEQCMRESIAKIDHTRTFELHVLFLIIITMLKPKFPWLHLKDLFSNIWSLGLRDLMYRDILLYL